MLKHKDGAIFAHSRAEYLDEMGGRSENKIYVAVKFDSLPRTFAILDTGSPWCILSKEQVEVLNRDYINESLETKRLLIRGERTDGNLIRLPITICAEEGDDITIEGTVFVPKDEREIPTFVGLDGFLNRIKFAIDPESNYFYFGSVG